jgi:ABC-2 type transport system permease protein
MTPRLGRSLRQTLTIARRDFIATVFTPIFLVFLLAPALMASFSAIGGMGAASVAASSRDTTRIVAIVPRELARPMAEADTRLRAMFRREEAPPPLATVDPQGDPQAQARALFAAKDMDTAVVMFGPLDRPHILYASRYGRSADYLALLAGDTLTRQAAGGRAIAIRPVKLVTDAPRQSRGGRNQSAFFAVFGIFFLTLFLSGQVIGTMAEERNNKVIEVLAAAVPLESVFLGKLVGMFGVAVLFVGFWGAILAKLGSFLPAGAAAALGEMAPAVGTGPFALLFAAYFTMAYLLLGATFLGVGAQASTMREIQLLSLPVTIIQVGMFGLSAAAVSKPGSWIATAAEVFPLSSPFAMAGRAAGSPALWPHLLALGWQALWVSLIIWIGARAFRRGVLQSGSARPRRKRASPVRGEAVPS